ncbi:aKG-HExxH-type peptide beta-hydroxylase [Actinomadura hibisca]|uniref:aKG-HExxH-type peptide beta-hydroxylase n=1 Tax=Actinomadura hibisca TaxID=68565 RepID=UPI00082BDA5A|nr:HEXXH motif-containing putative peptide modification protein [Actinomadura hibisca]
MITGHRLPVADFTALAAGGGDAGVLRRLREAERSKHVLMVWAIAGAAAGRPGAAAFQDAFDLLARVQEAVPDAYAWLLGLPHLGSWAHDCLVHLDRGSPIDLAQLACLAAAAAVRAGVPFALDVPVHEGRVRLPGLGAARLGTDRPWIHVRGDAETVAFGEHLTLNRTLLTPDDGTRPPIPHWEGTPLVRAEAAGICWEVLLETADPYLDRYSLPMTQDMPAPDVERWRRRVQDAWRLLASHHRWAAEPIAEALPVLVPLTPRRATDLVSATTPAAFGAVATSWPDEVATLAETLVHEFQHLKLCGLLDLIPLVGTGGPQVYAPWRQDPRPAGGLLQGIYAHLGIARFWSVQHEAETEPDAVLHAQASFARWRATLAPTVRTLKATGLLTEQGEHFVTVLNAHGRALTGAPLPDEPRRIAAEAALDHRLTWLLRHVHHSPDTIAAAANAFREGHTSVAPPPSPGEIVPDTRKVVADARTRALNLRYLDPSRYRALYTGNPTTSLSNADALLLDGADDTAVKAYRELILDSPEPRPDAWIGLALALHRLPPSPAATGLTAHLPLVFDVHTLLSGSVEPVDPLDLAGRFA